MTIKTHFNPRLAGTLVAVMGMLCMLYAPAAHAAPLSSVSSISPCVGSPAPAKGRWKHVIVLMFENQSYSKVIGSPDAPFISGLVNKCASAYSGRVGSAPKNNWHDSNYLVSGVLEKSYNSKPSYGVLTSGRPASETGIVDDTYSTTTDVDNIYNVLRLAGRDAKNYYSGTASATPCASSNFVGAYHDTLRYYKNLGGQSSDPTSYCNTHDKPITQFYSDLAAGSLPAYSMILPTNCQNMHSCSSVSNVINNADTWAKNFLNPVFESAQYKSGDTAIFYIWDEDTAIPNVLIAPSVVAGSKVPVPSGSAPISHYSALRTVSEMLGVPYVGYSEQAPSLLSTFTGGGTVTSSPGDTSIPTIALTSPANGATVTGGQINVLTSASDNTGVTKVDFAVNGQAKGSVTTAPYTFTWNTAGLSNGSYTIKATAYDAAGNSAFSSSTVTFVAPTACSRIPTDLGTATSTVSVPTSGTYHAWSRMYAPDGTNNSYYLQIDANCPVNVGDSKTLNANTWTWVNHKDGSTTPIDVSLTAGTHTLTMIGREKGVRLDRVLLLKDACTPTGNGDNCTATADTTPPSVTLTAPPANETVKGTIQLSATASDQGGSGVSRVEFFYNGTNPIDSKTVSPYSVTWDTTSIPNGTYALTAKATDAAGNSKVSASSVVTINNADTTPPSTPQDFVVKSSTSAAIVTSWSASTDTGGSGLAGYHLYRNGALISTGTETSFEDPTVSDSTHYTYAVDAYDVAGNTSDRATLTASTATPSDATAPTVPTNLAAKSSASGRIDLSWKASTDTGGSGIAGYYVRRNSSIVSPLIVGTTFADTTVVAGSQYTYDIIAVDGAKNTSSPSKTVVITTARVTDTTPPSVPGGVAALAVGSSQVNISWHPSSDTGGSGLVGYNVYRDGTKLTANAPTIGDTYGDATVQSGRTYVYTVTAIDRSGNESARSESTSVSTPTADSQVLLSDTFQQGASNWTTELGNWNIVNDSKRGAVYRQTASRDAWSTFGSNNWTDYSVEAAIRPTDFKPPKDGTSFAALYGRWQDESHWYYVVLRNTGVLELKRNNANTYTLLASKKMAVTPNAWYKIRLQMIGSSLKVYVDGKSVLSATDTTIEHGKVGLGTYYAKADYDDVIVSRSAVPQVLSFQPTDDAEIQKNEPTANFGAAKTMMADASPVKNYLTKFVVSGINGRNVTSAKLKLYNTNNSSKGEKFWPVASNNWKESSLTWSNAPNAAATPIFSLGGTRKGNTYEVDVSSYIRSDGTFSLRATTSGQDGTGFATKEATTKSQRPTLILTVQ